MAESRGFATLIGVQVYPEPNAICSDDVTLLDRTVTGDLEAVTDVFQAATVGGRSTFAAGRYIEPGSRYAGHPMSKP